MKPTTFVVVGLRLPSSSQRLVKRNVNGLAQTCNNYKPPRRVMKEPIPETTQEAEPSPYVWWSSFEGARPDRLCRRSAFSVYSEACL